MDAKGLLPFRGMKKTEGKPVLSQKEALEVLSRGRCHVKLFDVCECSERTSAYLFRFYEI